MVVHAETAARNAEADKFNIPGMCLQQTRFWCHIDAMWPDAATAWHMNLHKQRNKNVPRGAPVFWLGGSQGFGHIALSLGNGWVRSTDAGGRGVIATHRLDWFEDNWRMPYAGWSPSLNGVTIPGLEEDEMQPEDWTRLRDIVADEVAKNNDDVVKQVWNKLIEVTEQDADGGEVSKPAKQLLRQTWQRVQKLT